MDTLANASTLIAAEKVQGAKVYSATGDSLGSIDDIVINEKSGNVAYAIISDRASQTGNHNRKILVVDVNVLQILSS